MQLLQPVSKFKVLFLEITALRFISKQPYETFAKYLKSVGVNRDHAIFKCMETAIRASYLYFAEEINLGLIQDYQIMCRQIDI